MLEVKFAGPFALLPRSAAPLLLAERAAWEPGIYLWTFLYNRAHRVYFVGSDANCVAQKQISSMQDFLSGQRTIYMAEDLANGVLTPIYEPQDGRDQFVNCIPAAMRQLAQLDIFYAPLESSSVDPQRIADAIVARFQTMGGPAAQWLSNPPTSYDPKAYDNAITLRLGRPAFIASLPDEMHI